MLAALLIGFREGLEAALIVGIVIGYLKKIGHLDKIKTAWQGVATAVSASTVVAIILNAVGASLTGRAEEIFEGIAMFLAVGVLTWMIFWMRSQARYVKSDLEKEVHTAAVSGEKLALFSLTFLAVFREGVETALFLSASAFIADGGGTLIGALLGIGISVTLGYLIYASTVRLNLKMFFNVTSILLLFFAAGLLAHGVHEFQEAGLLPTTVENVWNTNHILNEKSLGGEIMKALFGYNGNPTLLEVISYLGYWLVVVTGIQTLVKKKASSRTAN